jgi:putative transposase
MRGQARDWGKPKTCTIMYKQGKWFASITVDVIPQRPTTNIGAVGIDFGVLHAAALSTGETIENPRFLKVAQEKINRLAKKSRRKRIPTPKQKPSRRWQKANKAVSKVQSKVGRQRQNWQHRVAVDIVSRYSFIATEKLNLKGMTRKSRGKQKRTGGINCAGNPRRRALQKSGLNRSVLDVGIGNLKSLIEYKVTEAGGFYIEIPTQKVKPSQTCPNCGYQKKKVLSERVHSCEKCLYTCDRDVAAAMVMLNYARGQELSSLDRELPYETSSRAESPSSILCGSMRQLGALKRRKQLAQTESASL